jgi:uncharacterized protein YndB with AHSA1/START domain
MKIAIETCVRSNLGHTWNAWNNPEDIVRWNSAADDWHTTRSTVDLRAGGKFCSRMEAKDGSVGFDFEGTYTKVVENSQIEYVMDDGRSVAIVFTEVDGGVRIHQTFDAEDENSIAQQREGWQNILENFARFVEGRNSIAANHEGKSA